MEFCRNDGEEMYDLLKSLEYEISDNHKVIGSVKYDIMRDAIYDFFDNPDIRAEDTLLFYFSGHGMPATDGDMYLASSEINPDAPYKRGFSAYELTKMVQRSVSIRIITILDCCYSGSARISKGHEDDAAKLGTQALENNKKILHQGEGKCLLAASQATQEAYGLKEKGHSIFTHYYDEQIRKLLLFQFKMDVEADYSYKYQMDAEIVREWELMRFENIQNYSKVTLSGYCKECKLSYPFVMDMFEFIRLPDIFAVEHGVDPNTMQIEESTAVVQKIDCFKCGREKCLIIIPNWYAVEIVHPLKASWYATRDPK